MTAKEYLLQAYLLEERIDSKLMQVEALRSLATKSTAIIKSHPGGGSGNDSYMEDVIIKIVDLEREISEEIGRLVELKQEIAEVIRQVEDPDLQVMLEMRYLCYQDWPVIMSSMHRSSSTIFFMHKKAMEKIETILQQKKNGLPEKSGVNRSNPE